MIDHFEMKVEKLDECREFYRSVLKPLGIELKWSDASAAGFGEVGDQDRVLFLIEKGKKSSPLHIAFKAVNEAAVKAFHTIGCRDGFLCNGLPGDRPDFGSKYYAAFLIDPDGNNIEAVCRYPG